METLLPQRQARAVPSAWENGFAVPGKARDGERHRTHDRTLTKRNNMQPMGAPADDGEDEMAITRVIMITTTVVQIENHRKRGRSPKVKVKTKSKTDTHTEEEVVQGLW